jgi:hypothetical protein
MLKQRPFLRALFIFIRTWIIAVLAFLILYFTWLRDWQMTWGATREEVSRHMAGDELLEDSTLNATRAVEIRALPERVWPWLVQMGSKRAGLYTFRRLDNAGMPSAERIIPEYQDLKVGDFILPSLKVVEMEPEKSMLWVFQKGAGPWESATWSWRLDKTNSGHTRLVSRLRQKYSFNSLQEIMTWVIMDPMEYFMMRTTLLGIKRRAESN